MEHGQFVGEFLPVKREFGVDIYYNGKFYTVYNLHQAAGAGHKKYAVSKRQFGVIQEFDDVESAIKLARELDS